MGVVDVKERMEKIKSTGYWRVNIRPTKFEKSRIDSLSRCWELVESCKVSLREWTYPLVNEGEKALGEDWVQSGAHSWTMVELWRLYQSGQFIHYFSCREDYRMDRVIVEKMVRGRGLSVLSTLYRVTEIFEFAARLAQRRVLQPRLEISIRLLGMDNRMLFIQRTTSTGISNSSSPGTTCKIDKISFGKEFSIGEIIAEGRTKALDATIHIFERFGWLNPSRQILAEDQRKFLERRL